MLFGVSGLLLLLLLFKSGSKKLAFAQICGLWVFVLHPFLFPLIGRAIIIIPLIDHRSLDIIPFLIIYSPLYLSDIMRDGQGNSLEPPVIACHV